MGLHIVKRVRKLSAAGEPEQVIHAGPAISRVALLAADYPGLIPSPRVSVGDTVTRGQPVLEDTQSAGIVFTAPGAGIIAAIHRDAQRNFISLVIELSDAERSGPGDQQPFSQYSGKPIPALSREDVRALLLESGLWTAFRARPFDRVPDAAGSPDGVFITAIDTEPLAPKPEVMVQENAAAFDAGLAVIAKLREGYLYLCVAQGSPIKAGPYSGVTIEQFAGLHPAGNPGVHIHTLPIERARAVWHIGYQDVLRIGTLFTTGRLNVDTVVSLAGPAVTAPRLVRTRLGASVDELLAGGCAPDARVLSGGILNGRVARGDVHGFLGRYHRIVAAGPASSATHARAWLKHGSGNPALPLLDQYRKSAMGMRPAPLLHALQWRDAARAQALGVLELSEDDLAVFTFGHAQQEKLAVQLREVLTQLEARS